MDCRKGTVVSYQGETMIRDALLILTAYFLISWLLGALFGMQGKLYSMALGFLVILASDA